MIPASGTWYPVAQRYPGSVATLPVLYQYLVPGPGTGTIIHMHTFYVDYQVKLCFTSIKSSFLFIFKNILSIPGISKKKYYQNFSKISMDQSP